MSSKFLQKGPFVMNFETQDPISFLKKAKDFSSWLKAIRRHIHQYPEPAFEEVETSKFICTSLKELGVSYRDNIARTGIIAEIGEKKSKNVVCLRADMDALSIDEDTGLRFSSKKKGVMHACGHDGHVAMLLGCARLLSESGITGGLIRLLFQPAEEGKGGAKKMVEEGCLEKCKFIFGGHIDTHFDVGKIAVQEGLICAHADRLVIEVKGRGGHAARPHEASDSIVAACNLVVMLQSAINKRLNPQFPSVVSIGIFEAKGAPNAICSKATLRGTIRTTDDKIRKETFRVIEACARATESAFGVETDVSFPEHYPPVVNDKEATDIARFAAKEIVGETGVIPYPIPSLGGEDFSFYLENVPGCFVRFGARKDGVDAPAHSSEFDFNEDVLPVGAAFFANCAIEALRKLK